MCRSSLMQNYIIQKISSSHQSCSVNDFCKIHGETSLRIGDFIKKRLQHRWFPVNFVMFLRTPYFQNTSGAKPDPDFARSVIARHCLFKELFSIAFGPATSLKRGSNADVFLWTTTKFLKTPILKSIYERLLLYFCIHKNVFLWLLFFKAIF